MPVQTAPSSFGASMPSIEQRQSQASEPDSSSATTYTSVPILAEGKASLDLPSSPFRAPPYQSFGFHRYRNSTSTSASSASSPATTASLLEPSSCIETPGTSPDTPASSNSYYYQPFPTKSADSKPDFRFQQTNTNPQPRKLRNTKNLALNTLGASISRGPLTGALPMASPLDSEASPGLFSPTFVKPAPPRRKSTALGLTIMTPASASFSGPVLGQNHAAPVPPTPGGLRPAMLRQFQSSPSLPLLTSSLPPLAMSRMPQFADAISEAPADETDHRPTSRDGKSSAYPDGPICIYDPLVYLYFEPTAQEAAEYDVIFNVASEVQNPFVKAGVTNFTILDLKSAIDDLPKHNASLSSTSGFPMAGNGANGEVERGAPQYIHIPWEHNTDIVPGTASIPRLHDIVRVIDDRVASGKRVLIHCQCGVSRSASLIVAYGIYKNPSLSVQQAYDMVKEKSKWIGPNMSLIMQLQEYHNGIAKSAGDRASTRPRSKILHGRSILDDANGEESSVPQTAPLPQDSSKLVPPPISTDNAGDVSAGPSSAPSGFLWPSTHKAYVMGSKTAVVPIYPETALVNASGQLLTAGSALQPELVKAAGNQLALRTDFEPSSRRPTPLGSLETFSSSAQEAAIDSAKSVEFSMTPLRPMDDDPTFGITSPRETSTFASSPLGVSPLQQDMRSISHPSQFAMTPTSPLDDDISLGLTSPRPDAGFSGGQIRSQFNRPLRIAALRPLPENGQVDAHARSTLRSQLGLSSNGRSSNNLYEAYSQPKSVATPPLPSTSASVSAPLRSMSPPMIMTPPPPPPLTEEPGFGDALMSPRATEFTNNPFHDALAPHPAPLVTRATGGEAVQAHDNVRQLTPLPHDPRSPAVLGSSPIVRNILDVLRER